MENLLEKAILLHKAGSFAEAESVYKKILSNNSSLAAHYLLGLLYCQDNKYLKAISHLEKSASAQKFNPDWHHALALCYQKIKCYKTALRFIKIAVYLKPSHPNYVNRYCKILNELQDFKQSIELMSNFLSRNNNFPEGYITLAMTWSSIDNPYMSTRCLIDAYRIFDSNAKIVFNLADAFIGIKRYKAASTLLNNLIHQNVMTAEALSQLAIIQREKANYSEALKLNEKAFHLAPHNTLIQWNYSLLLLLNKHYQQGWSYYDSSIALGQRHLPNLKIPLWRGESLKNKSILVMSEQGLGDQIMFVSHLDVLINMGANVALTCEHRLQALFSRSFPQVKIIENLRDVKSGLLQFDFCILIGSIYPVLSKLNIKLIPKKRFLIPTTNPKVKFSKSENKIIKIGFAWKGGATYKDKKKRSLYIKDWENLLKHDNIEYYCLQHTLNDKESNFIRSNHRIILDNSISDNNNFEQLCETISQLNLVITVDNTIAHLSAGLGIPTWCLIPFSPDWRWGNTGSTAIWYQSIRLFRQKSVCNWHATIKEIESCLVNSYPQLISPD